MDLLPGIIFITGAVTSFVGWMWLMILASKKNIGWVFLMLFIPISGIAYGAINWETCKRAMIPYIGGCIIAIGAFLAMVPEIVKTGNAVQQLHRFHTP